MKYMYLKRFTVIVFLMILFFPCNAIEPGNNLGKTLSQMKRDFPDLRYITTDAKGDKYQDGYTEEGISIYFYIKNQKVVEECLICQSNDGFAKMWFDSMVEGFKENTSYRNIRQPEPGFYQFVYSSFKINLFYIVQDGLENALIIYSNLN